MSSTNSSNMSAPIVLSPSQLDINKIKFLPPRINDMGGKEIKLISTQTNRALHISTPLMMTWGIGDYVNEHGVPDGKFSITLNFPNGEYATEATNEFLRKMKEFENKILDSAVEHSEKWWGEPMSREICKHTFFPFLKYRKNKDSKKLDYDSPPSIRAKVPKYGDKWDVELYDTDKNQLYPSNDPDVTPPDFVPKMSNIACVLICGGIWIGGKGWGITWRMKQGVVKPRVNNSISGICQIDLCDNDKDKINNVSLSTNDDDDVDVDGDVDGDLNTSTVDNTTVDDSDEDGDDGGIVETEHVPQVVKKKVVKKKTDVPSSVAVVETDTAPKTKKIIKKKVV